MDNFRIIPVIDIKDGVAVHAVKGMRNQYKPVLCPWCKSSDPLDLAKQYRSVFGLKDLYIADLDSIMHERMNTKIYEKIIKQCDGRIMVDSGITTFEKYQELINYSFDEIILGTESIKDVETFNQILENASSQIIISLDLRHGKVLSPIEELRSRGITGAFEFLLDLNPDAFILLDLANVGAKVGVGLKYAKDLISISNKPVYLGGGIKSIDDLVKASDLGFSGVLLATALQEELIKLDEINQFLSTKSA
ncbi:MAG: HisA/HisF-related TIM barrel protein [Promethearchaeota archaeon]